MSTKTKNYQFVKPEENEFYDINIPNANWDMADAELKRRVPEDGDISGTQVSTFGSITEEFPIPAAGDTTKTIVGKIKKFFEDFKNLKSSLLLVNQVVNNCTTDRGDLPGAAAQLKVLMDLYTKLNSDLMAWTYVAPTSTLNGCTMYPRVCGKVCQIYGSILVPNDWADYHDYDLGLLPENLRPRQDSYGLMVNGHRLAAIIVYPTGIIRLRPFLNGSTLKQGSNIAFFILYPLT